MTDRLRLDRVELADIVAPAALALEIHRQLGQLTGAVPVDDIARALDITAIRRVELDGCEGLLLTDPRRNYGRIAVNIAGGPRRARFSVAHELGHFLLENHVLSADAAVACSREDMAIWQGSGQHRQQESEANRFAIQLLAPRYLMEFSLASDPDLRVAIQAREKLDVSLEAVMRRYVELHDQPVAAVMAKGNIVRYAVRGKQFPWIKLAKGDRVSPLTSAHRVIASGRGGVAELVESNAAAWLENPDVELFEQTRLGQRGFGITLLWAPQREGEDPVDFPLFDRRRG